MQRLLLLRLRPGQPNAARRYTTASVRTAFDSIASHNPRLNALAHVRSQFELTAPSPQDGPLSGWTVAVKSNIATTVMPTTCGSQSLENYHSPFAASAVEALDRAGAQIIGASNMDEFGMGSKNQFSVHGPAYNPHTSSDGKTVHSPGGSSGGSAAAVAAGMCRVALGSDTGGSVRLPASWCGVVGFKPTYGRISRYGLSAYGSSLDAVGILARSTQDVQSVFRVVAVPDPRDMTCMSTQLRTRIDRLADARPWINSDDSSSPSSSSPSSLSPSSSSALPLSGVRIGIPRELWVEELSPAAIKAWKHGAAKLEALGCQLTPISLPHIPHTLPAYYTLALAEASSNLSRYDGIRFGTRRAAPESPACATAASKYAATRTAGLGGEARRRVILGTYVMSAAAHSHYYLPSQRIRRIVQHEFDRVFALPNAARFARPPRDASAGRDDGGVDAILCPTATDTAPRADGAHEAGPVASYVNDVMTVPANLAGIPAVSVPFGRHDGMPLGLQLAAQYGDDELLLRIARYLQSGDHVL